MAEVSAVEQSAPQMGLSWMAGSSTAATEVHLYVYVHGFHGNAYDLRGMRNQMAVLLPEKSQARYLLSATNEDHTATCSFERLGDNLAREVIAFMRTEGIMATTHRVSFICHSFGAVICRAALRTPMLEPILPKLHTYLSFSGPHLGMMYASNPLVELGIWGIRKFRGAQCLTELSLKDHAAPNECYMFTLSKGDMLHKFSNVILVSSAEDRYVPHHSARVQLCDEVFRPRGATRNKHAFQRLQH